MGTYLESAPSKWDKVGYAALGLLMLAFFASLPSMWADKQRRLEQAWQDTGCQMYDNMPLDKVPAKCATGFTDHYKPQEQRAQPPDATGVDK